MLASTALVGQPVPGGALFMTAQAAQMAARLVRARAFARLPRQLRTLGLVLTALSGLVALLIIAIYPRAVNLPRLWLVFALVLLVSLRNYTASFLRDRSLRRGHTAVQKGLRLAEGMLFYCVVAALVLFTALPSALAWQLLGGFALSSLIEGYSLYSSPSPQDQQPPPPAQLEDEKLLAVGAYRTFRAISLSAIAALQITMIMIYTYIGASGDSLLLCMGMAFGCTYLASRLTLFFLNLARNRRRDPANVLLGGLLLWLVSLLAFWQYITRQAVEWSYLALAACTAGTTITILALRELESDIDNVVAFAAGTEQKAKMAAQRGLLFDFAAMAGQMLALIGLALILFFGGGYSIQGLSPRAQSALLIPAAALVAASLPLALRFPLSNRYRQKLRTFLSLREHGAANAALQKQLEDAVVKVSRRRYGIKLLMLLLRPFFYNRVLGRENVHIDRDGSAIFVCNHGELYGPIVTNLYIPFSFRPWVISEMAAPEEIASYIYRYTIKRQRWLPERWKLPLARVLAPFLGWIMESIECIPVYRNKPRELIRTFQDTVAAMEAGDNILLFPENPNDPAQAQNGYLRDGIGQFYTGFVMVAQMYYQKTGKQAQFLPIYADKKRRTLTFGQGTLYDPAPQPTVEKQRIAAWLRNEMLRMAGDTVIREDA